MAETPVKVAPVREKVKAKVDKEALERARAKVAEMPVKVAPVRDRDKEDKVPAKDAVDSDKEAADLDKAAVDLAKEKVAAEPGKDAAAGAEEAADSRLATK